ncbi:PilZ domain-containing protein [Alteromonas sp. a30]|uniref:PilZ domain-containing protein n=1 Tax=Alteromonas sp. a30 TaxID=2730917 RepID=UPI002282170A|nr:PilZ domain-containing protein [Alteromonas sp. a30]MCY7297083.1 PilZ domain-containing protein [Alteromonas sp. a30]
MTVSIDLIFKGTQRDLSPQAKQLILEQAKSLTSTDNELVLKMEVRRLMSACNRVIDLRGKVDGKCEIYDVGGVRHCLDEIAKEIFDQKFKLYGGYTMGVYEAVQQTENSYRVRYQKDIAEVLQSGNKILTREGKAATVTESKIEIHYPVPAYCFSGIERRQYERKQLATPLDVVTESHMYFEAQTIDISLQGLKIKTQNDVALSLGDKVAIQFTGLASDYDVNDVNGEWYRIVHLNHDENERFIGLKRVDMEQGGKVSSFFNQLLSELQPVKHINVNHTLFSLYTKSFEQYFVNSTQTIPVFVELVGETFVPRYVLYNETNAKALHYWSKGGGELNLSGVLSEERLVKGAYFNVGAQYIYVFYTLKNAEPTYYVATQDELKANPLLRDSFLAFGARQVSWRVFKLEVLPLNKALCYRPCTTPDAQDNADSVMPIHSEAVECISDLDYVALLTDVTETTATLDYHQYKVTPKVFNEVKRYRCQLDDVPACKVLRLDDLTGSKKLTKNPFPLRTKVEIDVNQSAQDKLPDKVDRIRIEGVCDDALPTLLKVGFKEPTPLSEGQVVLVDLPELNEKTTKYNLLAMPYDVVKIEGGGRFLTLKSHRKKGLSVHPAEAFITQYSRFIAEKVSAQRNAKLPPDLGEALKNMFVNVQRNYAAYFKRTGNYRLPAAITRPQHEGDYQAIFTHNIAENLHACMRSVSAIFSDNAYDSHFLITLLKKLPAKPNEAFPGFRPCQSHELLIAYQPHLDDNNLRLVTRFAHEFSTFENKRTFVQNAVAHGRFLALFVTASQAQNLNWEPLRTERGFARKSASEAFSQFESELQRIVGVVELVDITEEVLRRLNVEVYTSY